MDIIIPKRLNFEFDPNIDKTRNVYQFLFKTYTNFRAGRLRLKSLVLLKYYSKTIIL